jgi:CMP-N,N'-diacetyllegionaminic acid synthase
MKSGLIIVPARGGSKGIPRKNLTPICGRPLLGYTLDICKQIKENFPTLVSTDDDEIAKYAEKQNFQTDYRRPPNLSTDEAHPIDAVFDGVKWYESVNDCIIDKVVLLQPTSPIRLVSDINAAIKHFIDNDLESLVGLVAMREHPYECIELVGDSGNWKYLRAPDKLNMLRQAYPTQYGFIDGSIYINKMTFINKYKTFVKEGLTYPFVLSNKYSVDIDEQEDLILAKMLIKSKI